MEYLDGVDLGGLVQDKGALLIGDAVEYVLQACDAVAEAHSLGIVHRDLKPRNLFLTRKLNGAPCIKVLDFGISKMTTIGADHSLTKTTDVIGSPNYMAPEQIRSSRDVDERTDIWAIGVILYELISGRVPFLADTVPALCAMVLEQAPTPLEELRPDCPPELRHVIARCLAKDPGARFQSVVELAGVLSQFVTGPSVASTVRWSSDAPPPAMSPRTRNTSSARVVVSGGTSVTWGETQLGTQKGGSSKALVGVIAALVVALAVVGTIAVVKLGGPPTPAASTTLAASTQAIASAPSASVAPSASIATGAIADAGAHDAQAHTQHPGIQPIKTTTATTATVTPPPTPTPTSGGGDLPRERK
jgi:serine/threonine-protein kinase